MTIRRQRPVPSPTMRVTEEIVAKRHDGGWQRVTKAKDEHGRTWITRNPVEPPELMLGEEVFDEEVESA